jgi:hypothetical protein
LNLSISALNILKTILLITLPYLECATNLNWLSQMGQDVDTTRSRYGMAWHGMAWQGAIRAMGRLFKQELDSQ